MKQVIVVAGMIRSGSTRIYNVARLLLEKYGKGCYSSWVSDIDWDRFYEAEVALVKLHEPDDAMLSMATVVITGCRNPVDVADSVWRMGWANDYDDLIAKVDYGISCYEYWRRRADVDIRYEEMMRCSQKTVVNIAKSLGLEIGAEEGIEISKMVDALKDSEIDGVYDNRTLLHKGHRRPASYMNSSKKDISHLVEEKFGDWMSENGYLYTPPRVAVLGAPGYLTQEQASSGSELIRCAGNNTGNLVFQYAVNRLLDVDVRTVGAAGVGYNAADAFSGMDFFVFPAANLLRPGVDFKPLAGFIRNSPIPLVVLGLGSQAPGLSVTDDAIAGICKDENVRLLADAIKEKAIFVSVRGEFSKRVCESLGIYDTAVLGCPSLLLYPGRDLGKVVARKIEAARSKSLRGRLNFAVSAAAPFEIAGDVEKLELERKLFRWSASSGGYYIQQSGGEDVIEFARGYMRHVRKSTINEIRKIIAPSMRYHEFLDYSRSCQKLYYDAREWLGLCHGLDIVLGTRMHGNMIALGVATPCVHIAHDARTSELIETMKLPYVSMDDVAESNSISDLLECVVFDPDEFDDNRNEIGRRFSASMKEIGIMLTRDYRCFGL